MRTLMPSSRLLPLLALLLLATSGCSDRRESLAREHLQQEVSSQSGGALTVAALAKTNGYDQNREGMTLYKLEWEARLAVQSRAWKAGWSDFRVTSSAPNAFESAVLGVTPAQLRKGATAVLRGESTLQKTEQGWRVLAAHVTASKIEPPPPAAINLTVFSSTPSFIVGCSSTYAETREDFLASRYLYADDLGTQCTISVADRPLVLKAVSKLDPAYFSQYANEEYTVSIKIEKTAPGQRGAETVEGTLVVQRKNGPTVTIAIYGERGC